MKIVGVTVGTTISPAAIEKKVKPVKMVNGISPDESGNVKIEDSSTITDIRAEASDIWDEDIGGYRKATLVTIECVTGLEHKEYSFKIPNGIDGDDAKDGISIYYSTQIWPDNAVGSVKGFPYDSLSANGREISKGDLIVTPDGFLWTSTLNSLTSTVQAECIACLKGADGGKGDKGDQGIQGEKGDAGYTPVKGKDYFTQADKAEMIGEAINSTPLEWLEYIESNGTQYIDTGFTPNSNTKVVMDAQFVDEGTRGALFGARTSATEKAYLMARVKGDNAYRTIRSYYFDYTDENGANVQWSTDGLERAIYIMDKNVASVSGDDIVSEPLDFSCKYPMFLMALNSKGSAAWNSALRIYGCQIYDNGTLIRDFAPVRTVTGEVGLFDTVHNKLYVSATEYPLIASGDSNLVGKDAVQRMIDIAKEEIIATVKKMLNPPNMISFSIGHQYNDGWTTYQAEEGMTWDEWGKSAYNTDSVDWYILNGYIYDDSAGSYALLDDADDPVRFDDVIVEDTGYRWVAP